MKVYLAHNGFLRLDSGASVKDYNHSTTTPIIVQAVGTQVWAYYGAERILKEDYSNIFQSDGVTLAGASAALAQTYIENLITVLES
jgi:hypothetical protein